jgi:hypothetical protein
VGGISNVMVPPVVANIVMKINLYARVMKGIVVTGPVIMIVETADIKRVVEDTIRHLGGAIPIPIICDVKSARPQVID